MLDPLRNIGPDVRPVMQVHPNGSTAYRPVETLLRTRNFAPRPEQEE